MKKLVLRGICLFIALVFIQGSALALDQATLEFKKVTGSVYVGKQNIPLFPFFGEEGPYLTVNFYVIANEDKTELVLIDAPAVLGELGSPPVHDLLTPFLGVLSKEFPEAKIKAVLLTHDHIDHISGSIFYFGPMNPEIVIYASAAEVDATPGPYDYDSWVPYPLGLLVERIDLDFRLPFNGGVIKPIDLSGHTPGQMGYAYHPDGEGKKIHWLFAGDALLAPPQDYEAGEFNDNVTYCFRLQVLAQETLSSQENIENWVASLDAIEKKLTRKAKVFPSHGVVSDGEFWRYPKDYIDYTVDEIYLRHPDNYLLCQ